MERSENDINNNYKLSKSFIKKWRKKLEDQKRARKPESDRLSYLPQDDPDLVRALEGMAREERFDMGDLKRIHISMDLKTTGMAERDAK